MQSNVKEVLAYEPYPNLFEKASNNISQSIRRNKIYLFNKAIVEPKSDYTFNIKDTIATASSSLEVGKGKSIQAIGLDKVLERINNNNIILKIDCEGGEFKIIRKGLDLSKVSKMQIETHDKYGKAEAISEILKSYGFTVRITEGMAQDIKWVYASK